MTSSVAPLLQPRDNFSSVKLLAESPGLDSIPSSYAYFNTHPHESIASDPQVSIPVIDFSLLSSNNPDQRLQAIRDLGRACQDWGFFMRVQVVNHGIPESLMNAIFDVTNEFFNLAEEEKMGYETKHVLDPIRYGTSFNASKEQIFLWRDFLKVFVHPDFHCPRSPRVFSELLEEYAKRTRGVARELLGGISQSLGLEEGYIAKLLDFDSAVQIYVANYYPPCPQPELAMGIAPHSDHGLLTLLLQNGVGGLQIQHNGTWVNVNALPNSFLVNTGDQLEIVSNGKYKSILHRAVVNNKMKRISIAMVNGPSFDACVAPASPLLTGGHGNQIPGLYAPMKYREYLEMQQGNKLDGKSCLDRVKVSICTPQ
nr:protein DMR6-LIKE OXYGENASE 2-like isoform X1 [Coffea arabica]